VGDFHRDLRVAGGTERAFGRKFERYAGWIGKYVRAGRALDIGCSTGLLVKKLCDRGFQAEGIELHPESAEWGRAHYGVRISTQPLEAGVYPAGAFDLAVLADVLEHTEHPPSFLAQVRNLLKPGGHLLVTFPDVWSLESRYWFTLSKLAHRGWLWGTCRIPKHTWEFTYPTAHGLFTSGGFDVVGFTRTHSMELPDWWPLKIAAAPTLLFSLPGIERRLGTQMEFMLRRTTA
jgi:SAM-dependent methyltransferase